jgi:hypothetical protein
LLTFKAATKSLFWSCFISLAAGALTCASARGTDYFANGSSTAVNGSNNGIANPEQITGTGSTLMIEPGATITLANADTNGVSFETAPGGTAINYGRILSSSDYSDSDPFWGMLVFGGSNGATLINRGVIDLTDDSNPIGIFGDHDGSRSDRLTFINEGTINLVGPTFRAISLKTSDGSTVTNSGHITGAGASGKGLSVISISNGKVRNSGSIALNGADALGIITLESTKVNISNSGEIRLNGDRSLGISSDASQSTVISNSGQIVGTGSAVRGILVFGNSNNAEISNSGSIAVSGNTATGIRLRDSIGSPIGNSGTINASGVNSRGIHVYASLAGTGGTVTNSGTIIASGTGGEGVRFEDFADRSGVRSLNNSGTIFAASTTDKAINFATASTDDSLTLLAGTRLQGRIEMNGGNDSVVLDQRGDSLGWQFTLDNISPSEVKVLGGPYLIQQPGISRNGVTVTVADLSRDEAAAGQLAQLSDAVAESVFGELQLVGASPAHNRESRVWGQAFADARADDGEGSSVAGTMFGSDTAFGNMGRIGVLAGAARSNLAVGDGTASANNGFAGAYGHLGIGSNGFAELLILGGYADGGNQPRQRANNLVTGGIETVTGSSTTGTFAAAQGRLGAYLPAGAVMLAPSLTLGYAHQWRAGYTEAAAGGTSLGAYGVDVFTGRLELAVLDRDTGPIHGVVRGGLVGEADVGTPLPLTLGGTAVAFSAASQQQLDGFFGGGVRAALGNQMELGADVEGRFGLLGNRGPGGRISLSLTGEF